MLGYGFINWFEDFIFGGEFIVVMGVLFVKGVVVGRFYVEFDILSFVYGLVIKLLMEDMFV